MFEYRCKIVKVVDGDTVDCDIDLGFGVTLTNERVRLIGVDAPESRTRDLVEKRFGLAAKERVKKFFDESTDVTLCSKEFKGKFGRILGDFKINDVMLTEMLLEEHYVAPYNGGSKSETLSCHLANRKILIESGVVVL